MKMLKVHQNAPTSMLKSENFSAVIPPDPRIKRGGVGLGRVGREGIGVWPTQKLSRGAPYELQRNFGYQKFEFPISKIPVEFLIAMNRNF
jgi:hypothetical protein